MKETSGIRPMTFTTNPDGSTKDIIVQLSNYHGVGVRSILRRTRKRSASRCRTFPAARRNRRDAGRAGARAGDHERQEDPVVDSKVYGYVAAYSLPDFKLIKTVDVGSHPEWMTIPPDGKSLYVAVAGDNLTVVVDNKTMEVVARIPVGQVPKRNDSGMLQTQ
jgi:YVTN family beta-propeller protein